MASPTVSLVGAVVAAVAIFCSTYEARAATYFSSSELRIGYRWPAMSTVTTRMEFMDLKLGESRHLQRVELREHIRDARANQVALVAQRRELGARGLGVGKPRAQRVDVA